MTREVEVEDAHTDFALLINALPRGITIFSKLKKNYKTLAFLTESL